MKKILSISLLLLIVSCGKSVMNAEIGTPFKMTSDQTIKIDNTDFKFEGFNVIEDSRCPKYANCFWEGQVVAEFKIDDQSLKFNSFKPLDTLGYKFQIKSVLPIKEDGVEISLPDYILEILITK